MNNAPSPAASSTSKKSLTITPCEPASRAALVITAHIASLKLPKFPVKLVGGDRLSPTDLRCKAALAVYAALPGLDLAILPTVATAAKVSCKEAPIACKDLIACGLVTTRVDDHARNVYAARSSS